MAAVTFNIGVAFGIQSTRGTADATIAGLSGSLVETDGIVLGKTGEGIGDSGITFGLERDLLEKAVVTGSFTRQPSDFVKEALSSFEIAIPLKGAGDTTVVSDGDFKPEKGVDALLESAGLGGGAWGGGLGWLYTPQTAQIITAKVFVNGIAWVVKDLVSNLTITFTPGEAATATFALEGLVDSFSTVTFPTFNYGAQSTLSAPVIAQVGHNWGISAAARGFSTAELTIDNGTEDVADSNAEGGSTPRQTGREITMAATIYGDDGDLDWERTELIRTTTPTDSQTFTVGTAGSNPSEAYRVTLNNPENRKLEVNKLGTDYAIDVELHAVDTVADAEFELIFL